MKKVAVVTGASRGIGRAIAVRLARMGYAVAVCYYKSTDAALALVKQLRSVGAEADAFACDVADSASVTALADAVRERLGEVTVLVNNAGIAQQKLFTDITDAEWDRMLGVHLTGAFYTGRAFLPSMIREHNGCIINVSSMWGQVGGSCEVHYSAAKAGLIGLTKALAKEVGPAGVRVNCVAPGVILTDMMKGFDEDTLQTLADETPLMKPGVPDDVANTVAFLVSDEASYITGQVIAPNGGLVI